MEIYFPGTSDSYVIKYRLQFMSYLQFTTIQSFPHITCCYVPVGKDIGSLICNVGSGAAAAGGGTATAGATDAAPQEEEKKEKKEESEEESDDDMGFGNENYVLFCSLDYFFRFV